MQHTSAPPFCQFRKALLFDLSFIPELSDVINLLKIKKEEEKVPL
jgi:hypothetical protein